MLQSRQSQKNQSAETWASVAPVATIFGPARHKTRRSRQLQKSFSRLTFCFGRANSKTFRWSEAQKKLRSAVALPSVTSVAKNCRRRTLLLWSAVIFALCSPVAKMILSAVTYASFAPIANKLRSTVTFTLVAPIAIDFGRWKRMLRSCQSKSFLSRQTQKICGRRTILLKKLSITSVAKKCGPRIILLWWRQTQKLSVAPGAKISVGGHFCFVRANP